MLPGNGLSNDFPGCLPLLKGLIHKYEFVVSHVNRYAVIIFKIIAAGRNASAGLDSSAAASQPRTEVCPESEKG